jgi:Rieske Fe-S protein
VVEGVRVTSVDEDSEGCTVAGDGWTVRSGVAVIATHLPIVDPALIAGRTRPERSYALAGYPSTPSPDGMYLAADEGWSLRPATIVQQNEEEPGDRAGLIVGGEGHAMIEGVDSTAHIGRLREWAHARFDMRIVHQWSAFDYRSVDGLPFVGRLAPGSHRRFTITGFGKWGMTMSMVSANVIADLVDGIDNPAVAMLDASRLLPTVGREVVKNNLKVAKRFLGDRAGAVRSDGDSPPEPGTGRITRRGARLVATACDLAGQMHSVDAACTHLGCIVEFNAGEQTWDCPCHGSRFTLDGAVLDGPASTPLEMATNPSSSSVR